MKAVAVVGAGGIVGGGHGNALIGRHAGTRELADNPAVVELVIEYHRVAITIGLAHPAKTAPNGGDAYRAKHRSACGLVKDLVALIDHLDVLGGTDFAVGVRWSAV